MIFFGCKKRDQQKVFWLLNQQFGNWKKRNKFGCFWLQFGCNSVAFDCNSVAFGCNLSISVLILVLLNDVVWVQIELQNENLEEWKTFPISGVEQYAWVSNCAEYSVKMWL